MSIEIIDCHTHVSARDIARGEFGRVLDRCAAMDVRAICVSLVWEGDYLEVDLDTLMQAARGHDVHVGVSMGQEPPSRRQHVDELASNVPRAIEAARALAADGKLRAIGEVGLDYYWPIVGFLSDQDAGTRDEIDRTIEERRAEWLAEPEVQRRVAAQRDAFRQWIDVAKERDLPLVVHERDACADAFQIIEESQIAPDRVMIHCFSAGPEMAEQGAQRGYWMSLPASMTYRQPYVDTAQSIDMNRALLETDAPYQSPIKGLWKQALREATDRAEKEGISRKAGLAWIRAEKEHIFAEILAGQLPGLEFDVPERGRVAAHEYFMSSRCRNINESTFVRCGAAALASLRGMAFEDVCAATSANARQCFRL